MLYDEDQFFDNEIKKIKDLLDGPRHTLKEEPDEKQYLTYLEKLTDFQENIKNVQTRSLEKQLEIKEIDGEVYGPYDDIKADDFDELADKIIKRKKEITPNSKLLSFNIFNDLQLTRPTQSTKPYIKKSIIHPSTPKTQEDIDEDDFIKRAKEGFKDEDEFALNKIKKLTNLIVEKPLKQIIQNTIAAVQTSTIELTPISTKISTIGKSQEDIDEENFFKQFKNQTIKLIKSKESKDELDEDNEDNFFKKINEKTTDSTTQSKKNYQKFNEIRVKKEVIIDPYAKSLNVETILLFNYKEKHSNNQFGYVHFDIYYASKVISGKITPEKIQIYLQDYLNISCSIETIESCLNNLWELKYYEKNNDNSYRLNSEWYATMNLVYGELKDPKNPENNSRFNYWINRKGEKIYGVSHTTLNNDKYFQKIIPSVKKIENFQIIVTCKSIFHFRENKYKSLKHLINEELTALLYYNLPVTHFDISRILHISNYLIDQFKCNKELYKQDTTASNTNFFNDENYSQLKRKNTTGIVFTKDYFALKFKCTSFIKQNIYFNENNYQILERNSKKPTGKYLTHKDKIQLESNSKALTEAKFPTKDSYIHFRRNADMRFREFSSSWRQSHLYEKLNFMSVVPTIKRNMTCEKRLEIAWESKPKNLQHQINRFNNSTHLMSQICKKPIDPDLFYRKMFSITEVPA